MGSNKINTNNKLINLGLYWIGGFSKKYSFISLYNISKDLNIPPISAKCVLAQCRLYTKWEKLKCIIRKIIEFKINKGKHPWTTQSRRLINRKNMETILNNITGKKLLKNHQLKQFLILRIFLNFLHIFQN